MLLSLLVAAQPARAADQWLNPWGAGDLRWGTAEQPLDAVPRARDFFLPDSGYLGRAPSDRPDDIDASTRDAPGERRFLRYVDGALVDAWLVREGPIDVTDFASNGVEQWRGVTLGPADSGFRAFGDAVSWLIGDRTALHWKDRMSGREILASRSQPSGKYGVEREAALEIGPDGRKKARITGDLKPFIKTWVGAISGCIDLAPKPVEGTIIVVYDEKGRPGRIKADTDQPSLDVGRCFAGAVAGSKGPAGEAFSARVFRMQ